MATKQHGGKITGLLALTVEAQEAINRNDPVHLVGDYEVEKADGTKPVLGFASVVNRKRVNTVTSTTVGVANVPGDITVEARGFMVLELTAAGTIGAGDSVAINGDSEVIAFTEEFAYDDPDVTVTRSGAEFGIALTSADADEKLDVLVR
jgi:hypothetical protein